MRALEFEAMVSELRAKGVPFDRAIVAARHELGVPAPNPDAERNASVDEKAEQREVTKIFRAFGIEVYSLSQARAAKVTPGLPDLWCVHRTRPLAWWWETKRQVGGHLSPAQLEFKASCDRCGVGHGVGDRHAAATYLVTLGVAVLWNGVLEPARCAAEAQLIL